MSDRTEGSGVDPTSALAGAPELRFPRYRLTVIEGPDRDLAIDGGAAELAIGTAPANAMILTDSAVSRHHVAITPTPRGHAIRDLGSTNGTAVNGVGIEGAFLAPGAVIAIGRSRLKFEVLGGEDRAMLSSDARWGRALGASEAMRRIFAVLPRLAESDTTILLEGETGTGKGLLAEAIHEASPRAAGPFVVLDCGAIPPTLIESELFGHEKGAFTGAAAARIGGFEAARGGTVFLDEIGELPLDMQPKLLRALEDRVVKRVGGNEPVRLDIRIIAATNRDLRSEINQGRFRSDLYYRLNTFRLRIPPLRERRDDIALLVAHFYRQLSPAGDSPPADLLAELARHDWPGNVRELRAAVERAVLLGDPAVWRALSDDATALAEDERFVDGTSFRAAKERAVAAWEREYVRALIARHDGNLSRAARAVRMDRKHLRELLRRHRITADDT
ncbi:MAG: sigma 54-dependent Fis family transcriptional regulator [Deltaproteobacteria bacterium]|nr:MAG: sigma 54-dependent Fis family transcriptional regulator [Deltaproteobacteria bacterium]